MAKGLKDEKKGLKEEEDATDKPEGIKAEAVAVADGSKIGERARWNWTLKMTTERVEWGRFCKRGRRSMGKGKKMYFGICA